MHLFCVQVVPLHLSQMQFFGLCDREEYVLGHSLTIQSTKVKAIGVKAAAAWHLICCRPFLRPIFGGCTRRLRLTMAPRWSMISIWGNTTMSTVWAALLGKGKVSSSWALLQWMTMALLAVLLATRRERPKQSLHSMLSFPCHQNLLR